MSDQPKTDLERLQAVFKDVVNEAVTAETALADLRLDAGDWAELFARLEEAFEVEMADRLQTTALYVGDLLGHVVRAATKTGGGA